MNATHWHLVINHLSIVFPIVGVIVMVIGLLSKSEAVKRTAYIIFILGGLASIAAVTTGESAEEVLKNISITTENYIEIHEESAEVFSFLSYILGGFSIFGLWATLTQKTFSNIVAVIILFFSLFVIFFGAQSGTTGGEIMHSEIRK
ncbi:hypothetical protein [Pedobacter sp.]|uniref:hypothetical protein n=1 Tax=Pedobacter sp. TaxID=1411316 RepID=UPI003D7FB9CF